MFLLQTMMTKIIGFASGAPSAEEVKKIARRASAGGDSVAAGGRDSLTAVVRMARMAIIAVMDTMAVWDVGAVITLGTAIQGRIEP
jgi:DNA-binding LytR/AlgR family response regulator